MMKNDIGYEYRVFTNRIFDVETMVVGICTSKNIKEIKPKDKVNGRFFHTSDTDEWYFCWDGELQKLNLKGDSDVNAALEEVERLITEANAAVDDAKATALEAKDAAAAAQDAADAATNAVESIENKADKSVVDALSQKIDEIEIPSLDGYATKEFVGEEIAKIEIPVVPTKVSEFENDVDYLTSSVADLKYAPIGSEGVDLSDYATKEFVGEEIAKIEIPVVPTKVSEFENDANYLTEHQDITGKQDVISDLETIRSGASLGATALQEVPAEYVTETELTEKGYVTATEINTKQDVISDLETIRSGASLGATALQEVPAEYVTETELDSKGYLTAHQSLDNYYTKDEIDSMINEINLLIGEATNITNTILA